MELELVMVGTLLLLRRTKDARWIELDEVAEEFVQNVWRRL